MSLGKRLRYAREKARLTLRQVEERTGLGTSSVSEYEAGKRVPRLNQLQVLADTYRRSVSFFLEEDEIPREVVLWRQKPEEEQVTAIQADFLRLCDQYDRLETWCDRRVDWDLPMAGTPDSFGYRNAERLARQVRADLQLGDRPGQSLLRVLEEVCGVKVFHMAFEPSGSAACTADDTYGPAILLNSGNVRWRRNFDLAHELFHILTWNVFRTDTSENEAQVGEQEEKFATCFASNLLMPVEAARFAIDDAIDEGRIAFSDLFSIARQFDVSVEALCWRMTFLHYFDATRAKEVIERYQASAAIWEGDRKTDEPPTRPARFKALAIESLQEGKISQGRFAEYLGISRRDAMRFVEQEALGDEEVQTPPA